MVENGLAWKLHMEGILGKVGGLRDQCSTWNTECFDIFGLIFLKERRKEGKRERWKEGRPIGKFNLPYGYSIGQWISCWR